MWQHACCHESALHCRLRCSLWQRRLQTRDRQCSPPPNQLLPSGPLHPVCPAAHLLPRVRCLAVLTFHQSFLGILLPVIVAACTAPGPLPLALLEARGVPAGAAVAQTSVAPCAGVGSPAQQAGRVRRAAAASLAAAWKACVRADEQVRERCLAACGSAQEAGVLAGACALLAANVWVLSVAGAARSAAGEVL